MSTKEFIELRSKRKSKYNAKRTEVDGQWFDSKLEASRYVELKALQKAGVIKWFICQTPFRLPGGITYRADFLRVNNPAHLVGSTLPPVEIEDCKGAMTRVSLNKIKQVEAIYGIKIELITRKRSRA